MSLAVVKDDRHGIFGPEMGQNLLGSMNYTLPLALILTGCKGFVHGAAGIKQQTDVSGHALVLLTILFVCLDIEARNHCHILLPLWQQVLA